MADEESTSTVLVAGVANLLIAAAKLVAGIVSGSAAMLSEAAHSFGDTMNQVFLMASLRRSRKPPDLDFHPLTELARQVGQRFFGTRDGIVEIVVGDATQHLAQGIGLRDHMVIGEFLDLDVGFAVRHVLWFPR